MLMNLSDVGSTTCVAIGQQRLFPTSGCLHGLLQHPSVLGAIYQDAVIGRLWLVVAVR